LGAALARIPVAHVEAGLRSHDRQNPWPEEDFRIAIDDLADLLFAPTQLNAANLRREGARGNIVVTGNTGIDALLENIPDLPAPSRTNRRHLLVTCHRRESWGEGLKNIAGCLRQIAMRSDALVTLLLHPNPVVAGEMRRLTGGCPGIVLRDPCTHIEMLQLMRDSDLILSDSGGVQEEAPALGVPLLVLRDRTERPEGILSGNTILVGREPESIRATVDRLLSDEEELARMGRPSFPYGDGRAGFRIAAHIAEWLSNAEANSDRPNLCPRLVGNASRRGLYCVHQTFFASEKRLIHSAESVSACLWTAGTTTDASGCKSTLR
jgi:UDP-N-acetylglucosamine 2-epimerase (non-hydrolysing)